MEQVRARLRGGPEDGREVSVPADPTGHPVPRITVPVRPPRERRATPPPLLVYERSGSHSTGTWDFEYVGAESQT
ncbi:hypothetical protein ACL03H_23385 [Saccharopolyspora sp. MS10]|uniref:hypothetical protein n=1 Tax=Saccharopolyspora sp. MS10 TaxID=3385973 RepID=UPI0039A076DB